MKKWINVLMVCVSIGSTAWAQDDERNSYQSEYNWGINKNSAGGFIGGFVFKKSIRIQDRKFKTYGIELMNVKSDQEVRKNSSNGAGYLWGKSNYLYAIRLQYGRDFLFFTKAPQQGVEIKGVLAGGPSIGVIAPYYIQWVSTDGYVTSEQYDMNNPNHTIDKIVGHGALFEGLQNSKFQFGVNAKAALNMEMGVSKSSLTGIEIGVLVDAYTKTVPLVPAGKQKAVFPTYFFTIYYGFRR